MDLVQTKYMQLRFTFNQFNTRQVNSYDYKFNKQHCLTFSRHYELLVCFCAVYRVTYFDVVPPVNKSKAQLPPLSCNISMYSKTQGWYWDFVFG